MAEQGGKHHNTKPASGGRNYMVSSVDRALTILEILAEHPNCGVTEIAQHLGGTKSLAFRLLRTLEARGFVIQDPDRRTYSLGYHAVRIGNSAAEQSHLISSTRSLMDELAVVSHENVNLVIRDDKQLVVVAARQSKQQVRLHYDIGVTGPLHAGGAAKILLAYAPEKVQEEILREPLQRFTPSTITDPDDLLHIIKKIRSEGLHVACNEYEEAAFSVAAPIFNMQGECVAALSVTGPLSRFDAQVEAELKQHVALTASRMSQVLGYSAAA